MRQCLSRMNASAQLSWRHMVAVWCNADQFARAEGLHELFTGMLDSDESEALLYRVETSQEERDCENVKLAMGLSAMNSGQMC